MGCGAVSLKDVPNPKMPIAGERQAEVLLHPTTGKVGIWEPTWSEANGVAFTLELMQKAEQDDILLDALKKNP